MNEKEKTFYLITNLPGSGKSTVGRAIAEAAEQRGLTTYTINEFELFGEWIEANPNKVQWESTPDGKIVNLQPQHYKEAFDHVAVRMVEEFLAHSDADVIISEAARDVAGIGYLPLFQHLVDALGQMTDFVNLNVYVDNIEELKRRVKKRTEQYPMSASVAVVNLYLQEADNYPHSTSTTTASEFPECFIYNAEINNSRTDDKAIKEGRIPTALMETVEGIVAQVIALQAQS